MAQLTDTDPNSNSYFFLTALTDNTFKAGKNSFIVNPTPRIIQGTEIDTKVYDSDGNLLPVDEVETDPTGIEATEFGEVYVVTVPSTTKVGIGRIEIRSIGIDLGLYTGSFAFFRGKAYPISAGQRLPLVQAPPATTAFSTAEVLWTRNVLIDTAQKDDSEIRFFDFPYISAKPRIYNSPEYPVASYLMASGSCSGVAVFPKNNANRIFDYAKDSELYQLFFSTGNKFSSAMEGEDIRIKSPYVKSFVYASYSNNQITYNGTLNTDFIAKIVRVVNDTTLILSIPFATISALVDRTKQNLSNEDSPYNKNNLVDPNGYTISDDPTKQTMYAKKNFYVLSIGSANYEVIYKSIPTKLPIAFISGSASGSAVAKSLVELEFNNLRARCGHVDSYKVYGRSLNSPESKTLLVSGRVEAEENIVAVNFNNGLYVNAGNFYDQPHVSRFWLTSSAALSFQQSNQALIDGVLVGHANNSTQADYAIFKDDTTGAARVPSYLSYNFVSGSYWYATSDAFVNSVAMSSASYDNITSIPTLSPHINSQENLLSGAIHDSNPIKLRQSTLYQFSMRVRLSTSNTAASKLLVYFMSGQSKKQIGLIDSTFKSITDELYTTTFFSDITQYGTIMFVPVAGHWDISVVSLKPFQALDYSVDSFAVKIPFPTFLTNELFEVEAELYDGGGRLAYGAGSYAFNANKLFTPFKAQFFTNPLGVINFSGGGSGFVGFIDGGNA